MIYSQKYRTHVMEPRTRESFINTYLPVSDDLKSRSFELTKAFIYSKTLRPHVQHQLTERLRRFVRKIGISNVGMYRRSGWVLITPHVKRRKKRKGITIT